MIFRQKEFSAPAHRDEGPDQKQTRYSRTAITETENKIFRRKEFFASLPRDEGPDQKTNKILLISDTRNEKLDFSQK